SPDNSREPGTYPTATNWDPPQVTPLRTASIDILCALQIAPSGDVRTVQPPTARNRSPDHATSATSMHSTEVGGLRSVHVTPSGDVPMIHPPPGALWP